jgi:hypothetical protein
MVVLLLLLIYLVMTLVQYTNKKISIFIKKTVYLIKLDNLSFKIYEELIMR